MGRSLNALFAEIGGVLGMTPAALYAHQRKFVAARLLESVVGRGPGSGVPGTPQSLATFLICEMANATLAENVPLARELLKAHSFLRRCALTGQTTLHSALVTVLTDPQKAKGVDEIIVSSTGHATIHYGSGFLIPGPDGVGIHVDRGVQQGSTQFITTMYRAPGGLEWRGVLHGTAVRQLVQQ